MAISSEPVIQSWQTAGKGAFVGVFLAGGLFLLAFAAIAALLSAAGTSYASATGSMAYILHVTGFTLFQAAFSAGLSLIVAVPVALSAWRRLQSWNAKVLIFVSFLPFVMPTTVAATGLIGVWGQRLLRPHGKGFSCMPGRGWGSAVGGAPGCFISVRASVRPSVRRT